VEAKALEDDAERMLKAETTILVERTIEVLIGCVPALVTIDCARLTRCDMKRTNPVIITKGYLIRASFDATILGSAIAEISGAMAEISMIYCAHDSFSFYSGHAKIGADARGIT